MKPAPFEYHAPETLEEALELLARFGEEATLLAGGQSLVPTMNFRLAQPAVLVDLNRVQELFYLEPGEGGSLRIGAMTRQVTVERSSLVRERSPLLFQTMPCIAHPQIRNRGTIGGSLAHADPSAELPAVLAALEGRLLLQGPQGQRWVDTREFYTGMFATDRQPDELLREVEIPAWPASSGWDFQELARRHGDYALVGVAAVVGLDSNRRCRRARLTYLSVGDGVVEGRRAAESLQGRVCNGKQLAEAARLAAHEDVDPLEDMHASVAYKRRLVEVLTGRALANAVARAREGSAPG